MRLILTAVVALCLTTLVSAQELQTGTKTCPASFVACVSGTSAVPNARQDVEVAFHSLWTACTQNGLHPLCVPTLQADASALEAGTLKWEAQFPLADKLDPAHLPELPGLRVRQLPETKVVFTYVTGEPWQAMETGFADLHRWAVDQGLPVTMQARAAVYVGMFTQQVESIVTECQLELRQ